MNTPGRKPTTFGGFLPDSPPGFDLEAAMTFDVPYPCPFCIDGFQPAGLHDDLGPVYASCLYCQLTCPTCEGEGLFPADQTCIGCFAVALAARGLAAVRCAHCLGVLDLIPTNHPEVFGHGRH